MIRVKVGATALAELRITTNPLWEVFGSLSSLTAGGAVWPYSDWYRTTERALLRRPGAALRPGAELLAWFRRLRAPLPTCLTAVPGDAGGGIEAEVDRLLDRLPHAPPRDVSQLLAGFGPDTARPAQWADWFATAVLDYWQVAMEPHWASMQAALRHEVLLRGQVLATEGSGGILADLGSRTRWKAPVLELPGCLPSGELDCTDRLVVVPLVFGRRTTRCATDGAGTVAVSCQARDATVLARSQPQLRRGRATPLPSDRLSLLLGRGRASILRGLATPRTTSELADALGMSASTVSQHLSVLLAAEVAGKHRMGIRVVYALNQAGAALLDNLDGPQPPAARRCGAEPAPAGRRSTTPA